MDLIDFARGPALQWSLALFIFGIAWRLIGVLLLHRKVDHSLPRHQDTTMGGVRLIFSRMWPKPEFRQSNAVHYALSYTFHIGLFIVIFLFRPHMLFIRDLTGLSWPTLPSGFVYVIGAMTLATLVAMLVRRMSHPVLKMISNFDDYFSWAVTALPVATGLLAVSHLGARYETLLALHILSVCLLLVWFPFGKLMHATLFVISRGTTGALFERKGAST